MGQEYLSIEATQSMDQIQGASLTYKIALGKYKGKKALTLQSVPLMEKTKDKFLSRYAGFSLHCGVAFVETLDQLNERHSQTFF